MSTNDADLQSIKESSEIRRAGSFVEHFTARLRSTRSDPSASSSSTSTAVSNPPKSSTPKPLSLQATTQPSSFALGASSVTSDSVSSSSQPSSLLAAYEAAYPKPVQKSPSCAGPAITPPSSGTK